jgi:hypothetical protein
MRLSHTNHSIYRGLIAFLRHQIHQTHEVQPDQEQPFQQLKKLPQLKPKRFPKGEPLKEDISEIIFNLEIPIKTQKYNPIRKD